ncbi:DUF4367 domain-containing protein [Paenibacillus lemnae]|uniref:DUF4367 domain-containing protein n=1 Tax=Paenibacillus lemnae TaxID=1330551 RepID=A0A848M724_PAELE|nr:DUF4367 domain-containing protein [Paenibacillus lemnae]NMO95882.1 DUF4367 domain-containing protein [Paenibacillus lemnae]
MSNEKFDERFDQAFEEAFDAAASKVDSPYPAPDTKQQSWQKIKQQLDHKKKRRKRKQHYQIAGVIAASVVGGAVIFSPPAMTQAISPIYQQVKDFGDGILQVVSGRDEPKQEDYSRAKTPPPPGYFDDDPEAEMHGYKENSAVAESNSADYDFTLEEVKQQATFVLPEFKYIPEGFEFDDIRVTELKRTDPINWVTTLYLNDKGQSLTFSIHNLADGRKVTVGVLGELSEITLKSGDKGQFMELSNGHNNVDFIHDNLRIIISGPFGKDELLKIANSMEQ